MKTYLSLVLFTLVLTGCGSDGPTNSSPIPEAPIAKSGAEASSPTSTKVTGDIVNTSIGSASAQADNPTRDSYEGHLAAYCVTQLESDGSPSVHGQYLNPLGAPVLFTLEPGKGIARGEFGQIKACRRSDGSFSLTQVDLGPGQPFDRNPHYTSLLDSHYIGGLELSDPEGRDGESRPRPRPTPPAEHCPTCLDIEEVLVVSHQVSPTHLVVLVGTTKPMDIVRFVVKVDWDADGAMDEAQTIDGASGGSVRFEVKSKSGTYQVHAEPLCGGGGHHEDDHGPCCHWDYRFELTQ